VYAEHLRQSFTLAPDTTAAVEVVAVDGPRRVSRITYSGHAQEGGGEVELVLWTVTEIDGLRIARSDVYEDEETARAALAAVPAARSSHTALERAFNERDWAALDAVLTEDYSWTDNRPGLRQELSSRAEFVEMLRTMTEGNDLRWETIAVDETEDGRGGLGRVVQRGTYRGGAYEIAFITIHLADSEGRSPHGEVFAVDDEASARRRLDELRSPVAQAYRRLTAAFNARDWDTFGAQVTDDFAWHDCRPSFFEVRQGRAAFVEWAQAAGAGDVQWTFETVEVRGRVQLARIRFAGNFRGGPYENVMYDVHTLGEDGLFVRTYAYEEAQLEEARARLEELAAEGERLESPAAWQTRSR
jgi:ketosteroid isomerase-like protein